MQAPFDFGADLSSGDRPTPASPPSPRTPVRLRSLGGALDPTERALFESLGSDLHIEAGHCLFREGERADHVFNLKRGSLKLYKLLPDGRRQVTGFLSRGEFLGLTFGEAHAFTAEAIEATEVCRISRPRFEAFVAERPAIANELFKIAAHVMRAAQDQYLLLGRKSASERIATFLLQYFERSALAGDDPRIARLAISRLDIADYLGLTKETVSRILSTFRRDRLIRFHSEARVELLDRDRMAAIAGGFAPAAS